MNICYVNPTNNIRRPIAELANILATQGHTISIMYPSSQDCPTDNWVANQAIKNPKIKTIPIKSWYFAPLRYSLPNPIHLFQECKKALKENDKIHVWEYYYPLSIMLVLLSAFNKQNRKKVILTTDGFVGYSYKPKEPKWLVPAFKVYTNLFARLLFKIPSTLTTYGNPMLPHAQKAGMPLHKLKVLSTGIHLQRFEKVDKDKTESIRKEFNLENNNNNNNKTEEKNNKNQKVLLYIGMLTERKRVHKVIEVSQALLEQGMNLKTILVGDAHGENIYTKLIKPEHQHNIIFAGGRKEIAEFMQIADALLLPSEGEGLPGVVMEAMASGLPVVATDEGCTPDLVTSGKEGFLVNDDNYLTPVKELLTNPQLNQQMRLAAREKIAQFSWDKVAQKYKEMYQD
ncbi:glycosyltransferase family 4 protein [Candidatus Woesearchaeota archaeon]|nr:glycosyltransferase family 4 protein [Candidatus Woesearchaeota archaeon]